MPSTAVLIGRFQPFHEGHRFLVETALAQFDRLIIVIGSAERARSTLNPFTYNERVQIIKANLESSLTRIDFIAAQDIFYDEPLWYHLVHTSVMKMAGAEQAITLIGHNKDFSSYYLQEFPHWSYLEVENYQGISATPIRQDYLLAGEINKKSFSKITQKFLANFLSTPEFKWLQSEAKFLKIYKESWSAAPYPPIFVTTDTVCICNQHILLIKRKYHPGQGLYALPGGFVEPNEWIKAGLIRELLEETQIQVLPATLLNGIINLQVFDYPGRSQIGRVITHVGLINLQLSALPEVHGSDDAGEALWLPLSEFINISDQLHDDHFQIVNQLIRQGLI